MKTLPFAVKQVRSPSDASGRAVRGDSLAQTSCRATDVLTQERKGLHVPFASAASCAVTTWQNTPGDTYQQGRPPAGH